MHSASSSHLPYFPLNKLDIRTLILDLIFWGELIGRSSALDQKIPKAKIAYFNKIFIESLFMCCQ